MTWLRVYTCAPLATRWLTSRKSTGSFESCLETARSRRFGVRGAPARAARGTWPAREPLVTRDLVVRSNLAPALVAALFFGCKADAPPPRRVAPVAVATHAPA